MVSKNSIIDIIQSRYSCRTYEDIPIKDSIIKEFTSISNNSPVGPFGGAVRFELFYEIGSELCKVEKLGTYGFINGARSFVAGAIKSDTHAMEDFGYIFEWFILKATELGLGTCWLGATFQRTILTKAMQLSEGEIMPAATPVGYPAQKQHVFDKTVKAYTKPRERKKWGSLFFDMDTNQPLKKDSLGNYATALEMVRLAPSASNQQPWRVLYDNRKNIFHFVLHRTPVYSQVAKLVSTVDLQMIDMGIAMCHFELSARELGSLGSWNILNPGPKLRDRGEKYLASWSDE